MASDQLFIPPELVDVIVRYLFFDKRTLRSCTLVSRTWRSLSQDTLFCDTRWNLFYQYGYMTKVHRALRSNPHLGTLFRKVSIEEEPERSLEDDDSSLAMYISDLTFVLSHLPNLVFMDVQFAGIRNNGAVPVYLGLIHISPSSLITELSVQFIHSCRDFRLVFEALEGTHIKRVSLFCLFEDREMDAPVKRLHLPSLECISLSGGALPSHLQDWLMRQTDLPNLTQCEIAVASEWWNVQLHGYPPLKLLKIKIDTDFIFRDTMSKGDTCPPLPLAGLHCQHVHFSYRHAPGECSYHHYELYHFVKWWSSTFRALSESDAPIHFTELTFTFSDPLGDDALKEAWRSLDDSLSHPLFDAVRRIHFEQSDDSAWPITRMVYPDLVDKIRLALPLLAGRGVLYFA